MGINTCINQWVLYNYARTRQPYTISVRSWDTIIQPPGVIFSRKVPPVEDFHQATYLTCLVRVINQKHLPNCYEQRQNRGHHCPSNQCTGLRMHCYNGCGCLFTEWRRCHRGNALGSCNNTDLRIHHDDAWLTSKGNGQPLLLLIPPSSLPYGYIAWIKPELHALTLWFAQSPLVTQR